MKSLMSTILIILLALVSIPAFAQRQAQGPPPDDRPGEEGAFAPDRGPGEPPSAERREKIRDKIEAIRIWRLTEELNLDANTSGKLAALLGSLDRKRRDIRREQMELMRTLRQSLKSRKPDDAKIKQSLEKLERNDRALQELKYSEIKGVKEFLTVEQQARFLIFQQEFQREIQNMIARARAGRGPGAGQDFPRRPQE